MTGTPFAALPQGRIEPAGRRDGKYIDVSAQTYYRPFITSLESAVAPREKRLPMHDASWAFLEDLID